jgi:peptidoglycan-associated lipoprotein
MPAPQPAAEQAPPAPAVELSDIFFDFDRFTIRSEARAALEADAGILKAQSDAKILIEGHCDERGTSAYNLILGERRAQAARQYLQDLGVPSSQIQITSFGKERPFCTEHSEACWQSNRRAHFTKR